MNPLGSYLLGKIATASGPFRSESLQHDFPRKIWMIDFVSYPPYHIYAVRPKSDLIQAGT